LHRGRRSGGYGALFGRTAKALLLAGLAAYLLLRGIIPAFTVGRSIIIDKRTR
jgi:hypothetical protein